MLRKDTIEAMNQDVQLNFMHDLPTLRYQKEPLYVWLWDQNKNFGDYKKIFSGLSMTVDYRVAQIDAYSVENLTPSFNGQVSTNSFDCYLTRQGTIIPSVTWKPRKVHGKLFEVSLEGLEMLDYYYAQGYNFNRGRLQVKASGSTYNAFFYHNTKDQLVDTKGELLEHLEFIEPDTKTVGGTTYYTVP